MNIILEISLIVFAPFLFIGVVNRIKAIWAGRRGAPLLQPFYDFFKLMKKAEVISSTTSFVFRISPSVNAAAVITAFLILPLPGSGSIISFTGDFVLFSYLLAFGKFFTVIAALDTGSSFEGMGAARETTFSTIVEPAFFILLGTLALITGHTSFSSVIAALQFAPFYTILVKILFAVSLFIMLLAEGSRVPVDDPNTHLELTMIHEVMVLDYSGPDLAFILYASSLKMVLLSALIAGLLIPAGGLQLFQLLSFGGVIFITAVAVGLIESLIARARMSHVPQFLFLMTALSITAFAVVIFFLRGGR